MVDEDPFGATEQIDEFDYKFDLPAGAVQTLRVNGRYSPQSK